MDKRELNLETKFHGYPQFLTYAHSPHQPFYSYCTAPTMIKPEYPSLFRLDPFEPPYQHPVHLQESPIELLESAYNLYILFNDSSSTEYSIDDKDPSQSHAPHPFPACVQRTLQQYDPNIYRSESRSKPTSSQHAEQSHLSLVPIQTPPHR